MKLTIESSWKNLLSGEFQEDYFHSLVKFLSNEYRDNPGKIFPEENEIFAAFNACNYENIKVVIIGQDPYPTKGFANGLCFSVNESVYPLPKSLQNIFKALHLDLKKNIRDNGNLMPWAKQGVFLLNTVLTVKQGLPESHAGKGWEQFTDAVIRTLNHREVPIVFMLWGSKASSKAELIDAQKHNVLIAPHPSPLSAYRGFFDCRHFSLANQFLQSIQIEGIDW